MINDQLEQLINQWRHNEEKINIEFSENKTVGNGTTIKTPILSLFGQTGLLPNYLSNIHCYHPYLHLCQQLYWNLYLSLARQCWQARRWQVKSKKQANPCLTRLNHQKYQVKDHSVGCQLGVNHHRLGDQTILGSLLTFSDGIWLFCNNRDVSQAISAIKQEISPLWFLGIAVIKEIGRIDAWPLGKTTFVINGLLRFGDEYHHPQARLPLLCSALPTVTRFTLSPAQHTLLSEYRL